MIYPTTRIPEVCNLDRAARSALMERAQAGNRQAMRDLLVVSSYDNFKRAGLSGPDALGETKKIFAKIDIKTKVVE